MKICQKCSTENSDIAMFCNGCGSPLDASALQQTQPPQSTRKKNKKVILSCFITLIVLVTIIVGIFIVLVLTDDTPIVSVNENGDVVQNGAIISEYDYKLSCKLTDYDDIARNPDKYKGENLVFIGKVVQCERIYGTSYYARVDVTVDITADYKDIIYVTFDIPQGESKILKGDIVMLYGVCQGTETYTSVLGEEITIPAIQAAYIDIR